MSFGFAFLGTLVAIYVYQKSNNVRLTSGIIFFVLMELLQGVQYFWIDECDNLINRSLTIVGFAHICLQPFFTHLINSAMTRKPVVLDQYKIIFKLCLLGGGALFARYLVHGETDLVFDRTREWLRGSKTCTYKGTHHLAWSVPMKEPSYFVPSSFIHNFLMIAPFFAMTQKYMWIQGVFLFASGPYLSTFISENTQEQASIWCFFSIAQISIMVFLIRDKLIKPAHLAQLKSKKK